MLKKILLILLTLALIFPVVAEINKRFLHFFPSEIKENPIAKKVVTPAKTFPVKYIPTNFPYSQLSENQWVDSVFFSMTDDQKIGQFFMVATYPQHGEVHFRRLETLIQNNYIGGLIFFQGEPFSQAQLTNRFQSVSKIPMLIAIDGEWGLGMRMNLPAMSFPKQITLGALQDNNLIYKMGGEIARQCKRVGVHLNFAPVVDINSNPNNPVIGHRSFGEERENVAAKSSAYMRGMQNNQLIACAKHFPGHGDTRGDSHYTLPQLSFTTERLKSMELYPFQRLIDDSVKSVIVGHLQVPVYDSKPATLSQNIITNLLKNDMGFKGLVITDALNMRGVRHGTGMTSGEVDLQAFMAGNDILLYSENIPEGIRRIKQAVQQGLVAQDDIDNRVKKILRSKYWAGLNHFQYVEMGNLYQELNTTEGIQLKQELFNNAVTVVKDNLTQLPFANAQTGNFISVGIDLSPNNSFHSSLSKFAPFQHFTSANKIDENLFNEVLRNVDSTKTVIVSVHDIKNKPATRFGVSANVQEFIKRLEKKTRVVLCVFGNPYSLKYFPEASTVVCGYEDDEAAYSSVAQILFGALPAKGKLPVSVENLYRAGDGLVTSSFGRLTQATPESVGMKLVDLIGSDMVIQSAIDQKVFPGCQLLVARKGKIVYQKNYGKLSYEGSEPVKDNTVYDLASVTKVASTLQTVMHLHDKKKLNIEEKASVYLPELKGTNKENIVVKDILWHQAGLVAYIPFWEKTRGNFWKPEFYSSTMSAEYPLQVADAMFTKPATKDSVWKWVMKSPLINKKDKDGQYPFVYSDLGLIILQHLVERVMNKPLDEFVENEFYKPLGMGTTGYNPLKKITKNQIAPTENDNYFRLRQVQGTVQDQTAAMVGGVCGHAGLFSSATDLAKLMQMNLDRGAYGGKQYFNNETVTYFANTKSPRSHRALGWDKLPSDGDSNYVSAKVSPSSFGHSGYTGTLVWVDPQKELVFIFLSNRVYPSATNNKINTLKVRRKVMDMVYQSME